MLSIHGIIFLSFAITVYGSCVKTHQHKIVKLGFFYTEELLGAWGKHVKKSGKEDVVQEMQKLSEAVSQLFSVKYFKECSARYTIKENNVHQFPERYLGDLKSKNLFESARKFAPIARLLRFIYDQDWDFAFLFAHESEFQTDQPQRGSVASLDSFCSSRNAGIIISDGSKTSDRFFGINPKLLAHELGHGFGLHHDYECREEPCVPSGLTIMNSPGSPNAGWSAYSRRTFVRNLKMKTAYSCLKWDCVTLALVSSNTDAVRLKEIFDSPRDFEVVNGVCAMLFEDPQRPLKLSEKKSPSQYRQFIKYFARKDTSYYQVWKTNPQWYVMDNICKGIPCEREISKTRFLHFGFHRKDLEGEPCSVGKVCRNGKCVRK